ncbi:helix-turn-helix transcriptional regulator [Frankia sp. Cas3]|uniref:helix-turn-helix transcriptional regulator n=1 Tax=Frankia sp. Cas3 TaxID=3073926 RepID=UPI002AD51636|nr:helix-turn-helix transcriptional regulator [Frankia sp. Cas3]
MATEDDPDDRKQRLQDAGVWLRSERETRGWTGSDLARRLNVSQVRVSAYERGQYEVPNTVAESIAAAFELPLIETRRRLGLWVPTDSDVLEIQRFVDPAQIDDGDLVKELLRRYQRRTAHEIYQIFPHRADVSDELWDRLIADTTTEIFLGGYTNYFFWTERPRFSDTLRAKAAAGVRIRILLGDPEGEVTRRREGVEKASLTVSTRINIALEELAKLGPIPGIEVRLSATNAEAHVSRSIFRFDHEALVCEHIADRLGHGSLTFHLRRTQDGGPFDQYAHHLEHLWDGARPWLPTRHTDITR